MNERYNELLNHIKDMGSVVLAFSGGVDSTFLLKACYDALGDRVKAVTVCSPYIPKWEIEEAKEIANKIGIEHQLLTVGIDDSIKDNPKDRCYLCKGFIFSTIKDIAERHGYNYVVDGSNLDDTKDYRPGMVALKELEIRSPLLEIGMTKNEIRQISKELDLDTWDKPAYACLLTRIPYDTPLDTNDFKMVEAAELYMMNKGFRAVRVRKHGDVARIEVAKESRERLFSIELFDDVAKALKDIGFEHVAVDLEGYRTGSLNGDLNNLVEA